MAVFIAVVGAYICIAFGVGCLENRRARSWYVSAGHVKRCIHRENPTPKAASTADIRLKPLLIIIIYTIRKCIDIIIRNTVVITSLAIYYRRLLQFSLRFR